MVWLRLAMASFGVTTPLVSIVLSVFMAGLAAGSAAGGRLARRIEAHAAAPLRAYALAEALIGASGVLVPLGLGWGRDVLTRGGAAWDSSAYYAASTAWVAGTLLPGCVAMGATFPLAMAAMRCEPGGAERSFSYLYLANVLGATAGTVVSAFVLIETLGFRGTLAAAAVLSALLAVAAFGRSFAVPAARAPAVTGPALPPPAPSAARGPAMLLALGLTGLASMAMEIVWIRQFGPYLGPVVYTFASILAVYLAATFAGSQVYRAWAASARSTGASAVAWVLVGGLGLLPLVTTDPRLPLPGVVRLVIGIAPFCGAVGFLTPMLVDRWSSGDPDRAGRGYAVNVLGSIVGPLASGFWLLPWLGERGALVVLALPLFAAGVLATVRPGLLGAAPAAPAVAGLGIAGAGHASPVRARLGLVAAVAVVIVALTRGYEDSFPGGVVRRDHTATVIAEGTGRGKRLLVNGHATTGLTPITKWMAHLPLALLDRPPEDALVICFGMGTTFRSALSWGIRATAVELVPSVPPLFPYFHPDADRLRRSPRARVVIDDGRRFLERSRDRFDVVTIDPPDPAEAAGSSLLYSRELYDAVKRRLRPGGVVQQWVPATEPAIIASVARAIQESFADVRVFPAVNPQPFAVAGFHFLAATAPLPRRTGAELAARLPPAAAADLVEWVDGWTPAQVFDYILLREMPVAAVVGFAPWAPALEDDRPFNEYYVVRRWLWPRGAPGLSRATPGPGPA